MRNKPVEVLTPFACSVLFGRSGEAVRRATREGFVKSRLVVAFTAKQVRLIDLQSALNYWGKPRTRQLKTMRKNMITLTVKGKRYEILHPLPLVASEEALKHLGVEE